MSHKVPFVSVIVPAYNAAAFIERTLDSVRVQTFKDYEIIIVDDGSTDDTHRIAENYFQRYALVGRCLKQENKKIAGARNAGVRASQGEFISFLDSDDRWYPEKLKIVMAEFSAHPNADIVCHAENVLDEGRPSRLKRYGPAFADMYGAQLFGGCALSTSATTLRRRVFEAAGGFCEDPRLNTVEDYDLWMRLGKMGCRFRFIEEPLGEYLIEGHNSTRRIEYHHDNLEFLLKDHFASYFGQHPDWRARLRMRHRLSVVYRSALGLLIQYGEDPELQKRYLIRMLKSFPLDPKNLVRAAQWVIKRPG